MPKAEKDADNLAFAARLIALLESRGQARRGAGAYLARKYGVATVTANAWLNGEHKASIEHARRIAKDHSASFDNLYFGTPSSLPASDSTEPSASGAVGDVPPALSPRQRALLALFDGLTESQQGDLLRSAEATKQKNDALIEELVNRRKKAD